MYGYRVAQLNGYRAVRNLILICLPVFISAIELGLSVKHPGNAKPGTAS